MWNMFKVNNKNTRRTLLPSFWWFWWFPYGEFSFITHLTKVVTRRYAIEEYFKNIHRIDMKTSFSESVLHQSCGLNRGGQISLWVLDFSGDRAPSGTQKIGNSKRKFYILGTTRNTSLCSFLSKYHLQFSFLMCYHQKFMQHSFCSLNIVLISETRFASKNNFDNSNASV